MWVVRISLKSLEEQLDARAASLAEIRRRSTAMVAAQRHSSLGGL